MTSAEARKAKLVPVTEADKPSVVIPTTSYGDLLWTAWLENEAKRIRALGRQVEIVTEENGLLALWASPL